MSRLSAKPRATRWSVYLVRCKDGSLYTGIALNLAARIAAHNAGKGAKYTRPRLPVALAWTRRLPVTTARTLEYRLKRLTKSQKESLVAGTALRAVLPNASARKGGKKKKRGA